MEVVVLVLWLVQAVPGVLLKAFDIDTLGWISHENLRQNVFRIV
jgi:hypothetical protein